MIIPRNSKEVENEEKKASVYGNRKATIHLILETTCSRSIIGGEEKQKIL